MIYQKLFPRERAPHRSTLPSDITRACLHRLDLHYNQSPIESEIKCPRDYHQAQEHNTFRQVLRGAGRQRMAGRMEQTRMIWWFCNTRMPYIFISFSRLSPMMIASIRKWSGIRENYHATLSHATRIDYFERFVHFYIYHQKYSWSQ